MPGYTQVQSWFVQAIPALTKYITLDDGHSVTARLKVVSPTNSLVKGDGDNAMYYLGHGGDCVTPYRNGINYT